MRIFALSILLAAGVVLAGAANAQEAPAAPPVSDPGLPPVVSTPADPGWDGDAWRNIPGPALVNRMQTGVSALETNDFVLAEKIFANVLRGRPTDADANFYMGVAKMNLGKWQDAKKYLKVAVRKKPKHPDPKSRLGVTYAKLGDAARANAQRADLVKMADACKGACIRELSPYIAGGIEMIDEALEPSTREPASQG